MKRNHTLLPLLVLMVVIAGCAGGSGGGTGAEEGGTTTAMDEDTSPAAGDDGSSAGWCTEGQHAQFSNPETGEQASWEVQGLVEEDGRQVCKAVWETNQGETRRIEMFYTEDESYRKMIAYDADGEVVSEVRMSGDVDGIGGASGSGDSGSGEDWCTDGTTMQISNPQTGEQASWEVEGIVEEDGRQLCKAVWETNQGEVNRIEMLFSEDESYRKMITYDAEGEVIDEFELSGG